MGRQSPRQSPAHRRVFSGNRIGSLLGGMYPQVSFVYLLTFLSTISRVTEPVVRITQIDRDGAITSPPPETRLGASIGRTSGPSLDSLYYPSRHLPP